MAETSQDHLNEHLLPSQSAPPAYQEVQYHPQQPGYPQESFNPCHQTSFQQPSPRGSPYLQHGTHNQSMNHPYNGSKYPFSGIFNL